MIAVDCRHQSRDLGRILLADALSRAAAVADQIGLKGVALDVVDDGGPEIMERRRMFHTGLGFPSRPSRPARMFISIETVRNARV